MAWDWRGWFGRAPEARASAAARPSVAMPAEEEIRRLCQEADRLRDAGELSAALRLLEGLASQAPDQAAVLLRIGIVHYFAGQLLAARQALEAARLIDPNEVQAYKFLAGVESALHEPARAIAAATRALEVGGPDAELYNALGTFFLEDGNLDEALAHFDRTLLVQPGNLHALCNLEVIHARFGAAGIASLRSTHARAARLDAIAALSARYRAGQLSIDEADALCTLTNNHRDTFALAQELARDFAAAPGMTAGLATNFAIVHQIAGDLPRALAARETAFALDANAIESRHGLGTLLITAGEARWHEGWQWTAQTNRLLNPTMYPADLAQWTGEDLQGTPLFAFAGQGFGDALLCLRFIPILAARNIDVVLWVPSAVEPFARQIKGYRELLSGDVIPDARAWGCRFACELLDLPAPLQLSREDVRTAPRLAPPDEVSARWRARLLGVPHPRIGVALYGNPGRIDDWQRSVPVGDLAPLAALPGVQWVNLAVSRRAEVMETIARLHALDLGPELKSFADTAGAMAELDGSILIDAGLAHLSGALALPYWLMQPTGCEWRWQVGLDPNPFWASATLVRANAPGRWDQATPGLADEIRARFGLN